MRNISLMFLFFLCYYKDRHRLCQNILYELCQEQETDASENENSNILSMYESICRCMYLQLGIGLGLAY